MGLWYSRPVLFVADVQKSVDFYAGKLGFREKWRFEQEVAQVDRYECESSAPSGHQRSAWACCSSS